MKYTLLKAIQKKLMSAAVLIILILYILAAGLLPIFFISVFEKKAVQEYALSAKREVITVFDGISVENHFYPTLNGILVVKDGQNNILFQSGEQDSLLLEAEGSEGSYHAGQDVIYYRHSGKNTFFYILPAAPFSYNSFPLSAALYYCFIAVILLIALFLLYRPLVKLEKILHGAVNGEIDFDLAQFENSSPLSPIFSDLHLLLEKLKNLILRESTAVLMKKQAELDALQSQINPHFLYNTLDTIRGQADVHGLSDISQMSLALSKLFRYSISNHNSSVLLSEELDNIENYLLIQRLRFGDKFEKISRIDEDSLQCKVPKLLIQPIVENAVHHGLEPKLEKGYLLICTYVTQNRLIISIQDNGVGIPQEKLEAINEMLISNAPVLKKQVQGISIGLTNVNARIKLLFGDEYGIILFSMPGAGTNVQISLPIIT